MVNLLGNLSNKLLKRKKRFEQSIVTVADGPESEQLLSIWYQLHGSEYKFEIYDKEKCRAFLISHYDNNHIFKYDALSTDSEKEFFFVCAYIYERGGIYINKNVTIVHSLQELFKHRDRCCMVQGKTKNSIYTGVLSSPSKNPIFKMMLNEMCKTDSKRCPQVFATMNASLYEIVDRLTDCPLISNWNPLSGYPDLFLLKFDLSGTVIENFQGVTFFKTNNDAHASNVPTSKDQNAKQVIEIASCSMFGQDGWVLNSCNFKRNGYYVDIGSADGITANNTYLMDNRFNWRGLCIDPLATNMNTRTAILHKGIVYHSDDQVGFIYAQDRSCIEGGKKVKNGELVIEQARRTEDILLDYKVPSLIDYLSVSVEGSELAVLQGIDFKHRKFNWITVNYHDNEQYRYQIVCFLQSKGYRSDIFFPNSIGFVLND